MVLLFDTVKQFCIKQGFEPTYWLAFSGGLDSTVLLHLLVNLRSLYPLKLQVVHVHHGLSPNADHWAKQCEQVCDELNVECKIYYVDAISKTGESPEEIARERRYAVLTELMKKNDVLLTAHHQDDQAETVLLQLLRGAGPKGLSAMSRYIAFNQGYLGRPLLDFSRQALLHYAEANQLHWIDDESNHNISFSRNFIRHEVMPLLKSRWPSVAATLTRVADHCAQAQDIIETSAHQDLVQCYGSKENTLSVKKLLQFDENKQRQIIRYWLSQNHFPTPSTLKMHHILNDVLHAREDRLPHVVWGDTELRRYRDDLYVMPCLSIIDNSRSYVWDFKQPLPLSENQILNAELVIGDGLRSDIGSVMVRFRREGENICIAGRVHHHSLKKLFQSWGVPPWLRSQVPLLFVNDELIAVVGFFIADKYRAKNTEQGYAVILSAAKDLLLVGDPSS